MQGEPVSPVFIDSFGGHQMDHITLNAHAKINLSLEITGKRPDGYHDIVSFMQGIGLHDVMKIEKCTQKATKYKLPHCTVNGIVVYLCTDAKTIPTDMDNLAFRAVKAFMDAMGDADPVEYGLTDQLLIDIRKDLPVSAGIGGGSANAAACLLGLNEMTGRPFSLRQLMEIGAGFGADVPFSTFMNAYRNRDVLGALEGIEEASDAAWTYGIGEIVEAARPLKVSVGHLLIRLPVGIPEFGDGHTQVAGPGHGRFGILPVFADGIRQIRPGQFFGEFAFDIIVLQQHAAHHPAGGAKTHEAFLEPLSVLIEIVFFFHRQIVGRQR